MAKPKRSPSTAAIDRHVGIRVRERRIMLGLTQQQVADAVGVEYQQVHKYERGINRISAGRLYAIANILNATIAYFYEGLDDETSTPVASCNMPHERMLFETVRNFEQISNEHHREAFSQLAHALASH